MNSVTICNYLPNTGMGLTGLSLAVVLTIAGLGLVVMARRTGARTAAMALLPLALLAPAGSQNDMTNDNARTQNERCVDHPLDGVIFEGGMTPPK